MCAEGRVARAHAVGHLIFALLFNRCLILHINRFLFCLCFVEKKISLSFVFVYTLLELGLGESEMQFPLFSHLFLSL